MIEAWLTQLRERGEAFEQTILRGYLENLGGRGPQTGLQRIHLQFPELSSRETFERLIEAREANADSDDDTDGQRTTRRQLEQLIEFVATNIERNAAAKVLERQLELEASLSIDIAGEALPYRALPIEIQRTGDPDRRAALERALNSARDELGKLRVEAHARSREAAAKIGGQDYVSWRSLLSRYDLDSLAHSANQLLDATDDMARDALAWLLRGRVELAGMRPAASHDLLFAMRAHDLDELLSSSELWRVDDFLNRLGLDPRAEGRIIRDSEARPGKSPRAYCVPLRVPHEVHLLLPEAGGLPQWRALLHELGHALHNASIDSSLPFEHRRLGDASVSEAFAVLFDHLLFNPVWARKVLKLSTDKIERLVRTAAAASLLITRRHTAKLIHEIAYHREEAEAADLYVELGRRSTGVTPIVAGHEVDIDPELYCSRYVRAWLFEGLAHHSLRETYDEDWFLNPRAGEFFDRLFRRGLVQDLHELAPAELGGGLEVAPVVSRFEEVLS